MAQNTFTRKAIEEAENYLYNEGFYHRPIVKGYTIDGETSKDLDDGVMLSKKGENYLLQVSIADVSSVVKLDSELFNCAYNNVETIYRKNYNLPMIPRTLSEDKLSLLPGSLKPTITFDIEINTAGEICGIEIRETAFKSTRRLSYHLFDKIVKEDDSDDAKILKEMAELANKLLANRRSKGALAIYDMLKGFYTNEEGQLIKLTKENSSKSYIVVQEFMIVANKAVANYCAENNIPILYRNHSVKQLAPERDEIFGQINLALNNLQFFEQVSTRMSLWFQKAKYSPYLTGHFGLNEPAYTHVTSPIRRFADLINHYLLRSFIDRTPPQMKFEELNDISNHINEIVQMNKEQESQFFKELSLDKYAKIINELDTNQILELDDSEFNQLLRSALSNNICEDNLKLALKSKFNNIQIDVNIVYLLLFKQNLESDVWRDIILDTFKFIYFNKGYPYQILNILAQKQMLSNFSIYENTEDNLFCSIVTGKFNDITIVGKKGISGKKKEATHYASILFLKEILNIPDDKYEEITNQVITLDPKNLPFHKSELFALNNREDDLDSTKIDHQQISEIALPNGFDSNLNYTGELLEFMNKSHVQGNPTFDFQQSGPSHLPTITCTCSFKLDEISIDVIGIAQNKKAAKQIASYKMMKEIEELIKHQKIEIKKEENEDIVNYVGKMLEICTKYKFKTTEFKFNNIGDVHKPLFECEIELFISKEWNKFRGVDASKKDAKQKAAENCLIFIKNNLGSI